ncbi:DUF6327 family protein [Fluviicola sp.]|uniref:DUF6327 family protein n=1 Tax=Fluviicola sp. TaxID=1917219 RepID=UPI0031D5289C
MSRNPPKYNSFEEIDLDLKILKLEREIHAQKFKRGLQGAKQNLRPANLLEETLGGISEPSFIERIVSTILHFVLKSFKE